MNRLTPLLPWVGTAILLALYVHGPWWPLGFVALVPWLAALERATHWRQTVAGGLVLAALIQVAGLGWMPAAVSHYTGLPGPLAWAVWLLAAPLLQPQALASALAFRAAGALGRGWQASATAAAWVAAEWACPRLLGETLADGLYPATTLRQAADLAGVAGLTAALLVVNLALWSAWRLRAAPRRAWARPLALATAVPLALAGYGEAVLARAGDAGVASAGQASLRVALVQANLGDYEALRKVHGAGEVVRQVLDLHGAMSIAAVREQRADAVLWPETVYPTTLGHPKSAAGAAFDEELLAIGQAIGVPLVLGTYDRDADGEYNSAAFLAPGRGLLGHYRKTRLFPLTEYTPAWLEGPLAQRWLPWLGHWRAGDGARVFPLLLADGREVPVQALVCLDALDPRLAIDAVRQGAQALLTLSNDSWFAPDGAGPRLHLAAAAFRSIETRLPQYRAASTGISAVIDATGAVRASAAPGTRTLVVGTLPVRAPVPTLVVRWGPWLGPLSCLLLAGLALRAAWPALARRGRGAPPSPAMPTPMPVLGVSLMPRAARHLAAALRLFAGVALLTMAWRIATGEGALASNTLAQLRGVALWCLLPEALAQCLRLAWRAILSCPDGEDTLVLRRGTVRWSLPLARLSGVAVGRWPLPWPQLTLQWSGTGDDPAVTLTLCTRQPWALAEALRGAGAPVAVPVAGNALARSLASRSLARASAWAHPLWRFGLLPLLLALPAFRLHQQIAYGSGIGEWLSFGATAFLRSAALWWAAWALAVLLVWALLRAAIETAALLVAQLRPGHLPAWRRALEATAPWLLHVGLGGWLLVRLLA